MENKINTLEMKSALMRSGYLLENRIASLLNKKGLLVLTNYVFKDPETSKSREIDILADTMHELTTKEGCTINIEYIIEVINNTQPIAFIIKNEVGEIIQNIKFIANLQDAGWNYASLTTEYNSANSKVVSLQYCSFVKKKNGKNKDEWMAYHPDDLHETLKKLLYKVDMRYADCIKDINYSKNEKEFSCSYLQPVLVLNDDLYKINIRNKNIKLQKTNLIHYVFNHVYNGEKKAIVIDIVTEKYFAKYIDMLNKNCAHIKSYMDDLLS